MALQGTIDSFPVVDVLGLLSGSAKTGCLELTGDRGHGSLWLREGRIVDGGVEGHPTTGAAEVVFELLLFEKATFEFVVGEPGPSERFEVSVSEAVEQAEQMLGAWQQVRDVVPDLAMQVAVVAGIEGDEVTLSAADWSLVACCGAQPTVGGILVELGLGEFEGCSRLADLVERGLVTVSQADTVSEGNAPSDRSAGVGESSLVPDEVVPPPASTVEVDRGVPFPGSPAEVTPREGIFGMDPDTDLTDDDQALGSAVHPDDAVVAQEAGGRHGDPQQGHQAVSEGFPDHFPIDDLVGSGSQDGFDVAFSAEPQHAGQAFTDGSVADFRPGDAQASTDTGEPAPTDDVLAQIGRLSPKAAEAIAAALGDGEDG